MGGWRSRRDSAAADKLHDFQFVAVLQRRGGEAFAWQHGPVVLDRDAGRLILHEDWRPRRDQCPAEV